jgi:serine/threonine protein kinase
MRFLTRYELQTEVRRREQTTIYSALDSQAGLAVYVALLDGNNLAHLVESLRAELPLAQNADPHLLTVLGFGLDSAEQQPPYIISEALAGRSLRESLAGGPGLSPSQALAFCYEAARCVESLHGRGAAHGRVHIDEFVARDNGTLVLLTPALSDLFGADLFTGARIDPSDLRDYIAPERQTQYGGAKPTVAGDIYGLGVLLYHLLTGVTPGAVPGQAAGLITGPQTPPMNESPADALLRSRLRKFIQVATARDPVQRWPDIGTFIDALDQVSPDRQVEDIAVFKAQTARGEVKVSPRVTEAVQPRTGSLTALTSGSVYSMQAPRTTVGVVRASGFVPDISLNNESSVLAQYVSQHHLDLVYTGEKWYARPYEGARNPTFVDGRELQKGALYPLYDGSELALPALKLVFHLAEVTAQATLDKE